MRSKLLYSFGLLCLLLLPALAKTVRAQNIKGDKIQVAADALTVLKFNAEIKRFELGDREGYACQVRDNDNSIVIKTIGDSPASTNLVVIEGKRSHYFLIEYLPKIDINNTKLFYDFSDLKELRKRVKDNEEQEPAAVAVNSGPASVNNDKNDKKEEAVAKETKQERKAREKEAKRLEEEQKQQKQAEALAKQQAKDKELVAAKEQERLRLAEQERIRQIELDKQQAQARADEIKRLEAAEKARQLQKGKEIAQAKAEEKQKLLNEEKARKLQKDQEIAAAKAAEKQRLEEEAAERKKLQEEENARLTVIQKQKADSIARERAVITAAQNEKQREKDSIIAKEKQRLALLKKYPGVNFYEPPNGQQLTGEYFRPVDTAENYYVSTEILKQAPRINLMSETVKDVSVELQGITFSGVNAYMRLRVKNGGAKELALGRMNLQWSKKNGNNYNLFACYVTGFPIIPAGSDYIIVYVTRAVNAQDSDTFNFTLHDRLEKMSLDFPMEGSLYNREMSRQQH